MQELVKVFRQVSPGQVDIDAFEMAQMLCMLFTRETERLDLYSISVHFSSTHIVLSDGDKRFPAMHHDAVVKSSKTRKLSNYGSPIGKAVIKPVFDGYHKPFTLFMRLVHNEVRIQLKLDQKDELFFVFKI